MVGFLSYECGMIKNCLKFLYEFLFFFGDLSGEVVYLFLLYLWIVWKIEVRWYMLISRFCGFFVYLL